MKKFKTFQEEMTTTGDAGIPQDTKNMGPKKKRAPITPSLHRNNGKTSPYRKIIIIQSSSCPI